jgi:hypothetical protein
MIGSVGNSLRVPYTASSTLRDTGSVGTDGSTAPGSGYQVGSDGKARDERGLTAEDQKQIQSLKKRDTEVRTHENAHKSVGGPYAGSPTYSFQAGPDGQRYAIGGEVSIDAGPEKEPAATIRKMETVKRAALAPALLNLKHCCVNQWLSEIRILASSMQGDSVPDAFMAI